MCVRGNESGLGMGVADTSSMMTSFSGINGVAQQHQQQQRQLCVERLIQLATDFSCISSAETQGLCFIPSIAMYPLRPTLFVNIAMLSWAFIMPCNGRYTFSAGYQRAADVWLSSRGYHSHLEGEGQT